MTHIHWILQVACLPLFAFKLKKAWVSTLSFYKLSVWVFAGSVCTTMVPVKNYRERKQQQGAIFHDILFLPTFNLNSTWSKISTGIFFYLTGIPHSTCTICRNNLIKWCQRDNILKGLRVRAAGLKLFIVSIDGLVCQLCIGCSLSLSNNRTKLCVITDIFVPSYSFWLVPAANNHWE